MYNADFHLEILQDVLHLDNSVVRDSKVRQRLVQLLVEVHGVLSRLVEQAGTKHIISRPISNNRGTEENGAAAGGGDGGEYSKPSMMLGSSIPKWERRTCSMKCLRSVFSVSMATCTNDDPHT